MSEVENCSSSPLCHHVVIISEFDKYLQPLSQQSGQLVKKSNCYLQIVSKQGHRIILSQLGGTLMKKSTFQYISNSNVITGRWPTGEGEHFATSDARLQTAEEEQLSPSDTFKTWSKQDSVMTRRQTEEEEHFPRCLDSI